MEEGLSVFVAIISDEKTETGSIVDKLLKINNVSEAFELTGSFDILIRINSASVKELNTIVEEVRATQGVKSTNTYLILGEKR